MSTEGIFAALVMLVIGLGWLALPYLGRGQSAAAGEQERERQTLAAAYERALLSVRDLDEDFQVGKIGQDEYAAERARWTERGAALLEALDKLSGKPMTSKARKAAPPPVELDPVEQAIAAYSQAREQGSR